MKSGSRRKEFRANALGSGGPGTHPALWLGFQEFECQAMTLERQFSYRYEEVIRHLPGNLALEATHENMIKLLKPLSVSL